MKVSIVTVTYNSEKTVMDTLRSVKNQTYKNIEHIVVDGCSQDGTIEIIQGFNHHGQFISEKDNGIYDAMNKGISMASGDIIGILNSDDYLADNSVIERIVHTFNTTHCDALYGDLLYVDQSNTEHVTRKWVAGAFNRNKFMRGWMPPHPTFYVRRALYEKFGLFNVQLKSSADYDLLLRFLFVNQIKVEYMPGVLIHMRTGGQSTKSIVNRLKAHREDYKAWKLNHLRPNWYTLLLKPLRKVNQYWVKPQKLSGSRKQPA